MVKGKNQTRNLTAEIKQVIKKIPAGKVATYGQIALLAGYPRHTRQVVWILHSSSAKDNLPWHRVINRKGTISLKPGQGLEKQRFLLQDEGVIVNDKNQIDLNQFLWKPDKLETLIDSLIDW